jgi:hypothetical protein
MANAVPTAKSNASIVSDVLNFILFGVVSNPGLEEKMWLGYRGELLLGEIVCSIERSESPGRCGDRFKSPGRHSLGKGG